MLLENKIGLKSKGLIREDSVNDSYKNNEDEKYEMLHTEQEISY